LPQAAEVNSCMSDDRSIRSRFATVDELQAALGEHGYLADEGLSTALFLALRMGRPLLLEGESGVGKTEVAKTLAQLLNVELVRLQCYEGIDDGQALYEWDYPRQMLVARAVYGDHATASAVGSGVYREEFLLERPLLRAIRSQPPPVLLIDELDRADDEFEAFLLEVLSDFTVSIPELGTIRAVGRPAVVITSNRTRELHEALKRRCYFHWLDFPSIERETRIIRLRVPDVSERLARSVATVIARLREVELARRPGAAEAVDWAAALHVLGAEEASGEVALVTLGSVIKNRDDSAQAEGVLAQLGSA
jgi:MoxR-like ATPase